MNESSKICRHLLPGLTPPYKKADAKAPPNPSLLSFSISQKINLQMINDTAQDRSTDANESSATVRLQNIFFK
jgi:hypothetical protein